METICQNQKDQIEERLVRYIDDYGWGWGVAMHQINGFFGTSYTVLQLRQMYKLCRKNGYGSERN